MVHYPISVLMWAIVLLSLLHTTYEASNACCGNVVAKAFTLCAPSNPIRMVWHRTSFMEKSLLARIVHALYSVIWWRIYNFDLLIVEDVAQNGKVMVFGY